MRCPVCGHNAIDTKEKPTASYDIVYRCDNEECYLVQFTVMFDDAHSKLMFGALPDGRNELEEKTDVE